MSKPFQNPGPSHLALRIAALSTLATIVPAAAATFTYTPASGTGDLWSAGTGWDAAPAGGTGTRLTFATAAPGPLANASTNDLPGEFFLNILDLSGTGPATGGASVTVNAVDPATGLTLATDVAAPVVNLDALAGDSGLAYRINPVLTLANDTTFTGAGTATFRFSGGIAGPGRSLTKAGTSQMALGGPSSLETLQVGFNTPGGKITAEAGSSLTVGTGTGVARIGATNSANATGALDLSAAASFAANVTELQVGVNFGGSAVTAEGALNLSPDNLITATTMVAIGRSGGNFNTPLATATTPDGSFTSINTPLLTIGQGKSNGSFTLGAGASLDINGFNGGRADLRVGHNDQSASGNWSGSADFSRGLFRGTLGAVSIGRKTTTSTGSASGILTLGDNDQQNLALSATGSPLVIARSDAGTTGTATGTLTIGHLGFSSSITSTNNSTAILIGTGAGSVQRAAGTLNLGAGFLTITTTGAAIAGDSANLLNTSTLKFNGTTLIAGASSGNWIHSLTNARISDAGLTINTNGANVTVPQSLSHDPAGAAADGGLIKEFSGILTLSGTNTYSGDTTVNGGILHLSKIAALPGFDTPGRLAVGEAGGLGMNIGGTGEFTFAQLETYRTDGTFTGNHHSLILDITNAGGEQTYTSARTDMGSFIKRGSHKLTLGHDVDMWGSLEVGLNQNAGTLAIAAGKDFTQAPSDFTGVGTMTLGVATGSANSLGTLDASAADAFSMEVTTLRMGITTGTGTAGGNLSLPANSSVTAHTEILISDSNNTFNNVNSTLTTGAGGTATVRTPRLLVGHGKGRGFVNAGAGSTFDLAYLDGARTAMEVGNNPVNGGSGPWSGTANFSTAVFKGGLSSLLIGAINATGATSSVTGVMTLSNNPLNHLDIEGPGTTVTLGRYAGNTSGTATGTLTLGNLDSASAITSTTNETAILIATGGAAGAAKASGTLNLNGGTLTITTTGSALRGDTANPDNASTVNFNGITLKAGASSSDWIGNLKTANLAAGGLTLDTNGFDIAVSQAFSGTGPFTKSGTGTLAFHDVNSYTGSTTVAAGTLTLIDEALSDTAAVTVAAGAVLNLAYPSTVVDTVQSLSLGGEPAGTGIWGAVDSGAPNTSPLITGTGRLNVLTGPAGNDPYPAWAAQIPAPDERDRADDPDHDGFSNGVEYLFGTSPVAANGGLVRSSTVGNNLIVRWNQRVGGGSYQLQQSATLAESPWPASPVVPAPAADQSGVPENYILQEASVPIDSPRKFVRVSGAEN
ncbi:autotransporter-associated beta strand repeat-containing protein [Luteolibacter yonseiensis]|uniref:Autotransporter-associated beta strand repeat-containing protein n=1 Tax=Luteolibacter yonseiensis TaxID=1144680 RepID=A0A934V9P6_9BACT|nr:autotransporter-associated beta strand repeat-containing protein [Luteolibacter yonseiensis]MBK1814011.1 autotransporter-associated beta strand repeat-containing protein [Luteolibacter yonseiensis]